MLSAAGRLAFATAAVAALLVAMASPGSATFDEVHATPDVEIGEEMLVIASAGSAVGVFDIEVGSTDEVDSASSGLATCTVSVTNPFSGTRDPNTGKVTGTFSPVAKTSCGSPAAALYAVVVERKTVGVSTTDVKQAPPGSCQTGTAPCVATSSTTTYQCSPCNPASWSARSTHRVTLPTNRFFVSFPSSCTKLTATVIECRLTTGRLTIR